MTTDNLSEISENRAADSAAQDLDNSPGSQLQRAREAAGISRRELSELLCMTGNKLELLECDEYERLPSALYVRGYIRNICRELKIDEAPVLQAYSGYAAAEKESQAILAHVSRSTVEVKPRRSLKGLALLPLLAVAVVFWWLNGRQLTPPSFSVTTAAPAAGTPVAGNPVAGTPVAGTPAASAPAEEVGIAVDESLTASAPAASDAPVKAAEKIVANAPSAVGGEQAAAPAIAAPSATSAGDQVADDTAADDQVAAAAIAATDDAAAPAPADTKTPAVPAEAAATAADAEAAQTPAVETPAVPTEPLQLSFSEEAWVEVRDATGKLLLAKLQPAGGDITLEGQPPFKLMLGNAAATQVRFRGQLVASDPLGNRRTRRLTVGQ
ncbi:helix-turn-helix domain-containing protein [Microbulbifer sp. SAOS-129_SWC]|uniref:helix-turn-helix domain-containing protein n=1 Tax=Microbulbifer sp. SAOS-129_SWC TaxID=3145235 RepID=UPI003217D3DC